MENVVFNLDLDPGNSSKTIGNLKQQMKEATLETQRLSEKFGATSKEAINAARRTAELRDEIGDVNDTIKALSPDEKFNSVAKLASGIAGGFAAAQGALALFGEESEEVEKAMLKVQAALALSQGLNQIIGLKDGLKNLGIVLKSTAIYQKAAAAAQAIYSTVVGVSTGALKLFRLALIGTGIGAVIVGVGLLIANFDKLKKLVQDNSDKLLKLGEYFLRFSNPIGLTITAIEMLGKKFQFVQNIVDVVKQKIGVLFDFIKETLIQLGVLDSAEENANEAALERAEDKMNAMDKVMKQRERDIALAKAQGRSEDELREMEKNSLNERLNTYQAYVDAKLKLGEELTAEESEKLAEFKQEAQLAILEDAKLDKEATEKKIKEAAERAKKLADQKKKDEEEKRKAAEEEAKKIAELEKQLFDARLEAMSEGLEKELAQEKESLTRKLEAIKGNSDLENNLRDQLKLNSLSKQSEIETKFLEEEASKEVDRLVKEGEDKALALEAQLITMESDNQILFDKQRELEEQNFLNKIENKNLTDSELEFAEAEHQARLTAINKAEAEERAKVDQQIADAKVSIAQSTLSSISNIGNLLIKDAKKLEKFNKGVALAQLSIDTAKSISSTIAGASAAAAAGGPAAPFLLAGYIATGIATVTSSFLQAKKLLGGGGGGGGSAGGGGNSEFNGGSVAPQVVDRGNLSASATVSRPTEMTVKAVVVETDVTKSQTRVKGIEENATFGD